MLEKFVKDTLNEDVSHIILKLCLYVLTSDKEQITVDDFCEHIYISKKALYNNLKNMKILPNILESYNDEAKESIILKIYDEEFELRELRPKRKTRKNLIIKDEQHLKKRVSKEDVTEEIFETWKKAMGKTNRTILDYNRKSSIHYALENYSVDDCKKAIIGCSLSDFNMGRDPITKGRKHNGLDLIFRNAEKIETFIDLYNERH